MVLSFQRYTLQRCRRRPYRVECTGSLSTSEVKQHRARLVLGWGTAWEDLRVLSAFLAIPMLQECLATSHTGGWLRWAYCHHHHHQHHHHHHHVPRLFFGLCRTSGVHGRPWKTIDPSIIETCTRRAQSPKFFESSPALFDTLNNA